MKHARLTHSRYLAPEQRFARVLYERFLIGGFNSEVQLLQVNLGGELR